jgi:hypothetical protein
MAIGGPDRRQAFGCRRMCVSPMRPVVSVLGMRCGRKSRRREHQTGYQYDFSHHGLLSKRRNALTWSRFTVRQVRIQKLRSGPESPIGPRWARHVQSMGCLRRRNRRNEAHSGDCYFFAMKCTYDPYRFDMPISGDDPRRNSGPGPRAENRRRICRVENLFAGSALPSGCF